jgi:hypothetical protein
MNFFLIFISLIWFVALTHWFVESTHIVFLTLNSYFGTFLKYSAKSCCGVMGLSTKFFPFHLIMYWYVRPQCRYERSYCHGILSWVTLNGVNILTNFEWDSHSLCNLDGTGIVKPLHMVRMRMFQQL